jgi:hypothetical protein
VFFVRGFSGAWISPEGKVTADFSKHEKEERQIGIMDVMTRQGEKGRSLTNAEISDFGSILLRTTRNDQRDWRRHNQVIEALDAASGAVLWSHTYPKEAPAVLSHQGETNLVFSWTANSDGAKLEIAENPDLSKRWPKLDAAASDYFLESVDPRSGKVLGGVVARTGKGSFSIHEAESAGTLLVAADSNNRLLIYSLTSGERTGIVFGGEPVISVATGLMATQNERGELSLYDLSTLARREQYAFKSPIAFVAFAADNQRFVVLTGDQVAYTMELPVQAASALTH